MDRTRFSTIEPLESRIAPANLTLINPLPNLLAGLGKTGDTVDLGNLFDATVDVSTYRTHIEFITNFDTDPNTPGLQAGKIVLELFDEKAPLTVQNFISYVNNANERGDLDGVFFHRLIGGFVLQGGGFETTTPSKHIDVGYEVHNEFDPNDPERANVEGTVAMAKTGLGPNTATSEFFVNLADNRSNLDNQNGGFTVFGKVTQGMDVVKAIAALPTADLHVLANNGALTDVPVQGNYSTNNPTALPTADQYVTITEAKVVTPHDGVSQGVTFGSVSVTNLATNQPSTVVTGTIDGDLLHLTYNPGVGKFKVTVHAAKGDDSVDTSFFVTLQPDFVADASDSFSSIVVPGDAGKVKVKITNKAASFLGKVDVDFYLVNDSDPNHTAQALDEPGGADIKIGSISGKQISLNGGQSITLEGKVTLSKDLWDAQGGTSRIVAVVKPSDPSVENLFPETTNLQGTLHYPYNAFGTFFDGQKTRVNTSLTYTENGHLVTLTLKNGGYGMVLPHENEAPDLAVYAANGAKGTSLGTSLSLKLQSATTQKLDPQTHTQFHSLYFPEQIGQVLLDRADITGDVFATGGLKTLKLGNLIGDDASHRVVLGGDAGGALKATVQLGSVTDYSLISDMPLGAVSAKSWTDDNPATESITAPSLASLKITGNFGADVNITGHSAVGSFVVGGVLDHASVRIGGSVKTVSLGAMDTSRFVVGAATASAPAAIADFNSDSFIGSFVITGKAQGHDGKGTNPAAMIDSDVAALKFGNISVQSISDESGSHLFGFIADRIARYQVTGFKKIANLDTADDLAKPANLDQGLTFGTYYAVQLLS